MFFSMDSTKLIIMITIIKKTINKNYNLLFLIIKPNNYFLEILINDLCFIL